VGKIKEVENDFFYLSSGQNSLRTKRGLFGQRALEKEAEKGS
jgi:hypothetical protein